jgi:dolichol-phosphate mannosyltransferase
VSKPLGIVIPVYNEKDNIRNTLRTIEEKIKTEHSIFIIYDFEEDNTLPIIRELIQDGKELRLIRNTEGGVVNAIRLGLKEAEGDYLLVSMADLSDDYGIVDHMCDLLAEGYDLVCGSRYMKGGKQIGGRVIKKMLSKIAGTSLKYLTNIPTCDITNSFKLYRKSMLDSIVIESDGGFEIGMEIVVKAYFGGFKVTEVPSVWQDREHGKSRFKIVRWAPKYLKWYFYAIRKRLKNKGLTT